jgi:hypothetical protein
MFHEVPWCSIMFYHLLLPECSITFYDIPSGSMGFYHVFWGSWLGSAEVSLGVLPMDVLVTGYWELDVCWASRVGMSHNESPWVRLSQVWLSMSQVWLSMSQAWLSKVRYDWTWIRLDFWVRVAEHRVELGSVWLELESDLESGMTKHKPDCSCAPGMGWLGWMEMFSRLGHCYFPRSCCALYCCLSFGFGSFGLGISMMGLWPSLFSNSFPRFWVEGFVCVLEPLGLWWCIWCEGEYCTNKGPSIGGLFGQN